jgi:hypothetical protein
MSIKPSYIVTDMELNPSFDKDGKNSEHKTVKSALAAAKELLMDTNSDEVWVWRLSHVVSKPDVEPDVDEVK